MVYNIAVELQINNVKKHLIAIKIQTSAVAAQAEAIEAT